MSIEFFLVPNTPASRRGYIALTVRRPTVGGEALIKRPAEANTTLSSPDIRAVLSLLEENVMSLLLDGHRVETGSMLRLTPVVSGGPALSVKLEFRKERGGSMVESDRLRTVWRARK